MPTNPETTNHHESAEQAARDFLESIAFAQSLPALTASFGEEMPEGMDMTARFAWLREFGEKHLDFRKGKSRQETEAEGLTPGQTDAVMAVVAELGMQGDTEPTEKAQEFIIINGAVNQAPLLRVRRAKQLIESGVTAPYMVLLGSSAPLTEAQQENAANYAPGAKTQFDLMNGAVEHEFGVSPQDEYTLDLENFNAQIMSEDDADFWKVRYYVAPNGMHILSVSAPLRNGRDTANTNDTYAFMREVVGPEMLEGKNVLNVTTDLYMYQHADALDQLGLPFGANVETVGYGGTDRPASVYAQEINSAIRRGGRLDASLSEAA